MNIEIRGIAWNHTRGFLPVVATAQRFEELYPEIRITWEKRSLQAFADASMSELAGHFDLVVMDHPHVALAAAQGLLLPFEDWVPAEFLEDQSMNSVGVSHDSYRFDKLQWALTSDAAAPVATWREDLIEKYGLFPPRTWEDVLSLARDGFVTIAAFPIDVLMHSYMFTHALGHEPFSTDHGIGPADIVAAALDELRSLISLCDAACLGRNPICTAEWMCAAVDDRAAAYCPFAYSYSNYSRPGYAGHVLQAGDLVNLGPQPLCSTLGGAGIAVSVKTKSPRACMDYAMFTASPEIQRGIYFEAGGQPGHRSAWIDEKINRASGNFFRNTLGILDRALCRPKTQSYMAFQDAASPIAHAAVAGSMGVLEAAREMTRLWRNAQ